MSKNNSLVIDCSDSPSLTKQADKEACDINKILKRYAKTGVVTHMNKYSPRYGDVSEIPDFQTMQNIVIEAHASFDALPALIRKRFNNDPSQLIEFCTDPKNAEEALRLGLIDQPAEAANAALAASNAPVEGAKEGVKA